MIGISLGADALDNIHDALIGMFVMMLLIPCEALCLASTSTTPLKWMLNIRLEHKSEKIGFADAFNRSFKVWIFGWGAGVPLATLIVQLFA